MADDNLKATDENLMGKEHAKAVQKNHDISAVEMTNIDNLEKMFWANHEQEPEFLFAPESDKQKDEQSRTNEKFDVRAGDDPDIASEAQQAIKNDPGFNTAIVQEEREQAHISDVKEQDFKNQIPDSPEESETKMRDMQSDRPLQNEIASAQTDTAKDIAAQVKQEIPQSIKNQYLVDTNESKFFDKGSQRLAFEVVNDKRISTVHKDTQTIGSMLTVAQSKGWKPISLTGDKDFKREAWVQASMKGIPVQGYSPSKDDKALLSARIEAQEKNTILRGQQQEMNAIVKATAQAVVKEKVANPATQAKVLAAIDKRSADAIEHGKSPNVAVYDKNAVSRNEPVQIKQQENSKERSR